jgi:hypothetical protein
MACRGLSIDYWSIGGELIPMHMQRAPIAGMVVTLAAVTLGCASVLPLVLLALGGGWWWRSRPRGPGARLVIAFLVVGLAGCTQVRTQPPIEGVQGRSLGLQGRLADSDPSRLPPAVASALADSSSMVFKYSEQATHDHYTVPVALGLITSPFILLGAPLGQYTVNAKAELLVTDDSGRQLGKYDGEAQVSRWYGLYYGSGYRELEGDARQAVRRVIDEALYRDATRLQAVTPTAAQ